MVTEFFKVSDILLKKKLLYLRLVQNNIDIKNIPMKLESFYYSFKKKSLFSDIESFYIYEA